MNIIYIFFVFLRALSALVVKQLTGQYFFLLCKIPDDET